MRLLVAVLVSTHSAASTRCPPADDDCPPQPVKLVHPLFAWHLGVGGGPSVGFLWDLADGGHDPATRRLVVGWQQRVVRVGRPADLLVGVHARWRSGTFVVQPSLELATSLPGPLGAPGLAVGVLAGDERGAAFHFHMHLFALDYYVGVEVLADDARGVIGLQLTL